MDINNTDYRKFSDYCLEELIKQVIEEVNEKGGKYRGMQENRERASTSKKSYMLEMSCLPGQIYYTKFLLFHHR